MKSSTCGERINVKSKFLSVIPNTSQLVSRRLFLRRTVALIVAASAAPAYIPKLRSAVAPNQKLNIAFVGAGGRATTNLESMESENIVALCDVDENRAAASFKKPAKTLWRTKAHHEEWLSAIRTGKQPGGNFDYGGPLSELAMLGIIAMRHPDIKLEWNSEKMMFNNCTAANAMITPSYRKGWKL
jgi:hypothetical protein